MGDDTQLFPNMCGQGRALGRAGVGGPSQSVPHSPGETRASSTLVLEPYTGVLCTGVLHNPCCRDSPAALSNPESPPENAPAKPGAQIKYSLLPGDLGCTLERQEGTTGKGEPWPRVQNSKSPPPPPPPHAQPKFPVAPSKSLSPANPTLQPPSPAGDHSHPLICVSPSAKFSGNIRLEGCSRERSSD